MYDKHQTELTNINWQTIRKQEISGLQQGSKVFLAYSDEKRRINLIRNAGKFLALNHSIGKEPEEITVNLPKYFESIPDENMSLALDKHGKHLVRKDDQVVSLNIYALLLGGGQVSSKVLSGQPTQKHGTPETRAEELQKQIKDVNLVLEEWRKKYRELEQIHKSTKIEKIVEVPVEVVKFVEVPRLVDKNADEKISELKSQIENYEKRINDWRTKFYQMNENFLKESTMLSTENSFDRSKLSIPEQPKELVIQDKDDSEKLRAIKEKIRNLHQFSKDLQKKCISLESRITEQTKEVPVEVVSYVDVPVERVVYDNEIVENLRKKVNRLNDTLKEWQDKYSEYESGVHDLKFEPGRIERALRLEATSAVQFAEEQDDESVIKLKEELNVLKDTLKDWQTRLTSKESEQIVKTVNVPIEVVKYIERPVEKIKYDETKANELQSQINEIYGTIEDWKKKYQNVKKSGIPQRPRYKFNPVRVAHTNEEIEDERVTELNKKVESVKNSLTYWESLYKEVSLRTQNVIVNETKIEKPITRYVEKPVTVYFNDETKINELKTKIAEMYNKLEGMNSNTKVIVKKEPRIINREVFVPVEKVKRVQRKIQKKTYDEERIKQLTETLNELQESLFEWESKCNELQQKEVEVIIKTEEVPVEVIKYIEKPVYVSQVHEERFNDITRDYEQLQISINNWQEKLNKLYHREVKYVDKFVEVPVEVIQYIDFPVEVPVVDEVKLAELTEQYKRMQIELQDVKQKVNQVKTKNKIVVDKIVESPVEVIEFIEIENEVLEVNTLRIKELTDEIELLTNTLDQLKWKYEVLESREVKIIEKVVEIPIEVIEYVDNEIEIKKPDQDKVKALEIEHNRLIGEISALKTKFTEAEKINPKVVTREVEVLVEKIEYVDKVVEVVKVDEVRLRLLRKEYEELSAGLNNWKAKYEAAQQKQQKVVERVIETPIEVIEVIENEKIVNKTDEKRLRELTREYERLSNSIEIIKDNCLRLQQRQPKIVYKQVEVPVETVQYYDEKKEILIVDEELLRSLNLEIEELTKRHEDLVQQCFKLENTSVRVIDRHVEVANEVETWVEYEVETVEIDEKRIHELIKEIENLNHSIRSCEEKYNLKQSREIVIVPEIHEVPVEVIEYDDHEVEVQIVDEEAIDNLKKLYSELSKELETIQLDIRTVENDEGIVVEKIIKKPNKIVQKVNREVEVNKVDQPKVDNLKREIYELNKKLLKCNESIRDLQIVKTKFVEKRVEVQIEKEVIVDIENPIIKVDQDRINLLQKRVVELEKQLLETKPIVTTRKNKRIETVERFVDQPFETVKYVDTEVEVVKLDHDKFDGVVGDYNRLVDELKDWKIKYLELENQNPKIVEKIVKVPVEKIIYVDVPLVVMVEDKERIERLTKEYESLTESLNYWKIKTVEIENITRRVVEKYVDVPVEKIEYIDREVEVVKVDENKISNLTKEYENLTHELNRVKHEYLKIQKSGPIVVERIVEVPIEIIEEVEKIVEIKVVDQKKLDALTKEYNEIIEKMVSVDVTTEEVEDLEIVFQDKYVEKIIEEIQYEDIYEEEVKEDLEAIKDLEEQQRRYTDPSDEFVRKTQKYVKLPPQIVEIRKEIPYEIVKYNDREVTIIKRNEKRENELTQQIDETKEKIRILQEQCDRIEKTPLQVVRKVIEVPVEIIKYIDTTVEVVKYDYDKLDTVENGVQSFRKDLLRWLDKYRDLEEPEDILIHVKAEVPKAIIPKSFDEPYYRHDDDTRLRNVQSQMLELNNILIDLAARFRKVEQTQQKVVEVPVEVPIEVIRYVDKPYEVIVNDDTRIRELENEIYNLQKAIDSYSGTTMSKEDHIKEFHQTVKYKTGHVPRPKETYEVHDNVNLLGHQIEEMMNQIDVWKAKYKILTKRERKVIEKIVEVPVEVIKYVDKRIECVKQDDQRIQALERELTGLSNQFNEWQTIFSEQPETTMASTPIRSKKRDEVLGELPSIVKTDEAYLELTTKIANFSHEFNFFKKNVQSLENMEKIIIGKVIEVPKEVAEIIEYHIESEDYRPKQYLRQLETLNSKLEIWKKNIENKIHTITPKKTEVKLEYREEFIDNSPLLVRDNQLEVELENELAEITRLVGDYQVRSMELEYQKQEIIENFTQVVKEVEKVIYEDIEEIVRDTTHEEYLEKLIKETTNTINERKNEFRTKRNRNIEYFEKVVKVKREIVKNVMRNIEIPKYDESNIRTIEFKYDQLINQLERLIDRCRDLDHSEFEIIEREVKVEREVLKPVHREVGVEVYDEKPILDMVDKLNRLNKVLIEARNESAAAESGEVEIVQNIIKQEKEVVRYEIRYKDVFVTDDNQIKDLEERREALIKRVNKWQDKVTELETHQEVIVEKIIEIPVKIVKTYKRAYGNIVYEESNLKELAKQINNLNHDLINLQSDYDLLKKENDKVEERVIEVPKVIIRQVDNIVEKIIWDDSEIKELEKKIKEITKQITLLEDKTSSTESQRREVIEKVIKIEKPIKKYVIKDIEKVILNDEASKELEIDIASLNDTLGIWKAKLEELRNLQVPVIEKVVEIEKEKITKVRRVIEVFKNDDKAIQKALDVISILNRKIEDSYRKIELLERRSIRTVEKIVHVPKNVYVYKVKKTNVSSLDETNVLELEERKQKLVNQLSDWQRKLALIESEKVRTMTKNVQIPKKVIKRIKRDIEIPVFDDTEVREWDEKCSDLRKEIQRETRKKHDVLKDKKKTIERVKEVTVDIITFEDKKTEKFVWDEEIILNLQSQVDLAKKQIFELEEKKKEVEQIANTVIEQIVEVPIEKIKKVERKVDKVIWDDKEIITLQNKIVDLVSKINVGAHAPEQYDDEEVEYVEKIIGVPKEIVVYRENIKQRVVYDDSPIDEVRLQIDVIKSEIRDYKFKVSELIKIKERIIEKIIEEPYEVIKEIQNKVELVKFDEARALEIQKKIEAAIKEQDKLRNAYKLKKSIRDEVVEKEVRVEREVLKKVERLKEKVIWDNSRIVELENNIRRVKGDLETANNNVNSLEVIQHKIIDKEIKVVKEKKIYKEKIVQKFTEELGPIIDMENRIKNALDQAKVELRVVKTVEKKRKVVKDNIIELVRVEVKKVNRPIKVIKFDDTRVRDLQAKVDLAKTNYKPLEHDIMEIVEEDGDIIEKIIEVPVKIIKEVDRPIEKIIWDESNTRRLERQLEDLRRVPDMMYEKMDKLIEEKNKVCIEEHIVNVEVVKYLPRNVERVVYKKGDTEQLDTELTSLKNSLLLIVDQYNNLKNTDKEYTYITKEVPYETIKYVERPIEVLKIDQEKCKKLQKELERLKTVENEIKAKIDEVQIQKNTTIHRRKNILTEKVKTIERPIKTLKVSHDRMTNLEKQLQEATDELNSWQKRCEQYDIIKEKIIEVPREVVKEVEYHVDIVRADDRLVKELAFSLSNIRSAMTGVEIRHEILVEQQNEVIERIVEKPKKIEREVEREINIFKYDPVRINSINEQIKNLKSNLTQRRKDFNNYERNRNVTEERIFYEEEVVRLIQRPVELLTLDKKSIREISRQFDKAFGLLENWKIRYRELLDEKYTPEEKYIEVPVEKKKFAVSKVEIMKADENDLMKVESEVERMNKDIKFFQNQISNIQNSLKQTVINEKIVEVAKETIIQIEKPTHVYTIDREKVRELRNELKKLRTSANSIINRRY